MTVKSKSSHALQNMWGLVSYLRKLVLPRHLPLLGWARFAAAAERFITGRGSKNYPNFNAKSSARRCVYRKAEKNGVQHLYDYISLSSLGLGLPLSLKAFELEIGSVLLEKRGVALSPAQLAVPTVFLAGISVVAAGAESRSTPKESPA